MYSSAGGQPANSNIIIKPFVYGSIAIPHAKGTTASTGTTHTWKVFVRPFEPNGSCLSPFLENVTFSIHSSFAQPERVISSPPYLVEESGWGEFDVRITLVFKSGDHLILNHHLRLFPETKASRAPKHNKRPVISENYDEIIISPVAPNSVVPFSTNIPQVAPVYDLALIQHANQELLGYINRRSNDIRHAQSLVEVRQHTLLSQLLQVTLQERAMSIAEQYLQDRPQGSDVS